MVTTTADNTVVFDATGDAYHAIIGTVHHQRLQGDHFSGGDPDLRRHLADLVTVNPTGQTDTPR